MNTHLADHRSQANTLPVATSYRAAWTTDELLFVAEFINDRDEDIALALGRTLYAIRAIKTHLDERRAARRFASPREAIITSYDAWERSFD
jgi:hypothetical protein